MRRYFSYSMILLGLLLFIGSPAEAAKTIKVGIIDSYTGPAAPHLITLQAKTDKTSSWGYSRMTKSCTSTRRMTPRITYDLDLMSGKDAHHTSECWARFSWSICRSWSWKS